MNLDSLTDENQYTVKNISDHGMRYPMIQDMDGIRTQYSNGSARYKQFNNDGSITNWYRPFEGEWRKVSEVSPKILSKLDVDPREILWSCFQ